MSSRALSLRAACLSVTALLGLLAGCAPAPTGTPNDKPDDTTLKTRDMAVRTVTWNPEKTDLGQVKAVAENDGMTVVFNAKSALLFSAGLSVSADDNVVGVTSAAVIPAADHVGMWIAGADAKGKVWRLQAGESFEVVSNLYGLMKDPVSALVPMGETGTVFALGSGLAISDGTNVTRYDTGALTGVTADADRAAGVTADGVAVLDPAAGELTAFPLTGATAVAFDDKGRLLALTPEAIYREGSDGALVMIYKSEKASLAGLAEAPGKVWFTEGTKLGAVDPTGVGLSPESAVPESAALSGSESGDVWVLAQGALSRLAIDIGDEKDRAAWEQNIQPIFSHSCVPCHKPGGTAGIVLATYDTWVEHRTQLLDRVIQKKDMPPKGFELSDADRATIGSWVTAAP